MTATAGRMSGRGRRRARDVAEREGNNMLWISFGSQSGHLMGQLLEHSGVGADGPDTVRIQPEADAAVLELLGRAAAEGWMVELLDDGADEPDTGEGNLVYLNRCQAGEVGGDTMDEDGNRDGGYLRLPIASIEKIHIF